jgi:hypothetical protein
MDEEDCGKRYLCELAAGDALDTEEQHTLSFFQVFNTAGPEFLLFFSVFRIWIRIRIHMFLGLPDPDPNIIKQK